MKPITKQNVLNYILIFRYNKLRKNKKKIEFSQKNAREVLESTTKVENLTATT